MIKDWSTVDRCDVGTFYSLSIVFRKRSKAVIHRRMCKDIVNIGAPIDLVGIKIKSKSWAVT